MRDPAIPRTPSSAGWPVTSKPASERRAVVRALCPPGAYARLSGSFADSHRWGRVHDASPWGLGLLLAAPVEPGTVLIVCLHGPGLGRVRLRLARVTHATPQPDGAFLVGCALVEPLPAEVLQALADSTGRKVPASREGIADADTRPDL